MDPLPLIPILHIKTTGVECFHDTMMIEATKDFKCDSQTSKECSGYFRRKGNLHYCEWNNKKLKYYKDSNKYD